MDEWREWVKSINPDPMLWPSKNDILQSLQKQGLVTMRDNLITSADARRIYNWRAKAEQGVTTTYGEGALRRHVFYKMIDPYRPMSLMTGRPFTRRNFFDVKDIFGVHLIPKRSVPSRKAAQSQWEQRREREEEAGPHLMARAIG